MGELFINVLDLSIEASLAVSAVLLMRIIFRKAPKWLHCLMWSVVAVKLLCPFSLESEISPIPAGESIRAGFGSAYSAAVTNGQAESAEENYSAYVSTEHPEPESVSDTAESVPAEQISIMTNIERSHAGPYENMWSIIWLSGSAVIIISAAACCLLLRMRLSESVPDVPGDNVYRSDRIQSAFLFGLFRPRIYIPFWIEGENLRHVIAHERAHIDRRDNLTKAVAFLLAAVYWFNPVIWLAYFCFCRDVELACDERTVCGKSGSERRAYSFALLDCAAKSEKSIVRRCAVPLGFGESDIRRRVKNVLNMERRKKPAAWLIGLGIAAICAALAVVMLRPEDYSTDIPRELDEAVARAAFAEEYVSVSDITVDGAVRRYAAAPDSREGYECMGEGHIILGYKKKGSSVEVYALCSKIGYGFRNDTLVDETASVRIPTLIVLDIADDGSYILREAREAEDGTYYAPSVRRMFPAALARKALSVECGDEIDSSLNSQCRSYAEAYLIAIGREADISSYHDLDFPILTDNGVPVEVSNALYELHPEYGIYIGNFERLENGKRYWYSMSTGDNKIGSPFTVTFQKNEYDSGKLIERYVYRIDGDKFTEYKND